MKTIIHSTKVIVATLCAASLMGAAAFASNAKRSLHERGTIDSVNAQDKTLTVKKAHSATPQVFVWNDATKFLERGHAPDKSKTVTADQLKAGEQVSIRYEKEADHLVAKVIAITSEHHAAAKATQQSSH
jgi:hypothetical protein